MPTNIEIKANVRDVVELRRRAEKLSDKDVQIITQEDIFFYVPKGRFKLRVLTPNKAQLVFYERPEREGPKRSEYEIFDTNEPEKMKSLLSRAFGVRGVVKKVRRLYMVGQTRIHIDEVAGLGFFMELEVVMRPDQSEAEGQEVAEMLMTDLGIQKSDLLEGAYLDFIENKQSNTDEPKPT